PRPGGPAGTSHTETLPMPGAVLTRAFIRLSSAGAGRQREGRDAVVGERRREETAAGRRDRDVLTAVAAQIGAGCGMGRRSELHRPELLARPGVERAEPRVVGRPDEDEAARRRDRSAVARPSR